MPQRAREDRQEEALVLIKAVPRPSRRHGETVCCAGITLSREWRRLYPVRFRYLGDNRFNRWQWVKYRWRPPTSDSRRESRHVFEDSLSPGRKMPEKERGGFIAPLIRASVKEAAAKGESLALIRPRESVFRWKPKPQARMSQEKEAYEQGAQQASFLDKELAALEPVPYEFRLSFRDEDGLHHHTCSDWETTAAYWRLSKEYSPDAALQHLNKMYNEMYPAKGMVLALGTMAKRPNTWLLLGVIRVDEPTAGRLFP